MALRYSSQTFAVYPPPQWSDDVKPYPEDDESRPLDEQSPPDQSGLPNSRRHSVVKIEEDFHGAPTMYHERPGMVQMRHYSHPNVPLLNTSHHMGRPHEHAYPTSYSQAPQWPMSSHSGSNTPTPMYGPVQDPMPVQFASTTGTFPFQQQGPASAISMSPQSSQGGWASAASSDSAEQRIDPRSPRFRAMSPMTVLRSDGIRKKNARFEIPRERNLTNIDALINASTDDQERRELKQQKRLLRNRQAALDSRQRKKTHTEKLELEKKMFNEEKKELENAVTHIENNFAHEREQWRHQQQQYESFIQQLQFEKDEAIRTKTIETGDLRRQNNVLKECVRDLERQQHPRTFNNSTPADTFSTDFGSFSNLDIGDNWEDEFSLIDSEDLKMEGEDTPQRQLTPRPPPPSEPRPATTSKQDASFSWNTFYMCLLFGAFIASNASTKDSSSASASSSSLSTQLPALSDDYRNEAGNVLKAVLGTDAESAHELIPPRPSASSSSNLPATISGSEFSRMTNQPTSSLESLHTTLTTPSRQQQVAAAFSLSTESYNHITNPDGIFDDDDDHHTPKQPSQLEQIFASMQAQRDDLEKLTGLGARARERSVLLDRVPEKVLKDFREMVEMSKMKKEKE